MKQECGHHITHFKPVCVECVAGLEAKLAETSGDTELLLWLGAVVEDDDKWMSVAGFIGGFMEPWGRGGQPPPPEYEDWEDDDWCPGDIRLAIRAAKKMIEEGSG
jgi:hypothetical protein